MPLDKWIIVVILRQVVLDGLERLLVCHRAIDQIGLLCKIGNTLRFAL